MEVTAKAAVVTGGGTGVGRATALRLAAQGCDVAVNYSRSEEAAELVAKEARALGVKSIAVRADVSNDADCRALIEAAVSEFGHLEILVNNAGTTTFVPHPDLEGMGDDVWDQILAVNLKGPFLCSRAAKPHLEAAGGGEIVMTSSVAGLAGIGSSIAYCASKAGLNNLTVTLARALGPANIRVNGVAPGFIDGDWLQQGLGEHYEAIKQGMEGRSPLGRVCTPDDVALQILAVITGSDLVTGHVIPIEAGVLIAG